MTALHHACKAGNVEAAKILLSKTVIIDIQDNSGLTVLHYAIAIHNDSIVSMILDHGPDLLILDLNKISYLEHALNNFKKEVCSKFIKNWPRKYRKENTKETWLHFCATKGFIDQSEMLLKEGYDIDQGDNLSQTPLHYAIRSSKVIEEKMCILKQFLL